MPTNKPPPDAKNKHPCSQLTVLCYRCSKINWRFLSYIHIFLILNINSGLSALKLHPNCAPTTATQLWQLSKYNGISILNTSLTTKTLNKQVQASTCIFNLIYSGLLYDLQNRKESRDENKALSAFKCTTKHWSPNS